MNTPSAFRTLEQQWHAMREHLTWKDMFSLFPEEPLDASLVLKCRQQPTTLIELYTSLTTLDLPQYQKGKSTSRTIVKMYRDLPIDSAALANVLDASKTHDAHTLQYTLLPMLRELPIQPFLSFLFDKMEGHPAHDAFLQLAEVQTFTMRRNERQKIDHVLPKEQSYYWMNYIMTYGLEPNEFDDAFEALVNYGRFLSEVPNAMARCQPHHTKAYVAYIAEQWKGKFDMVPQLIDLYRNAKEPMQLSEAPSPKFVSAQLLTLMMKVLDKSSMSTPEGFSYVARCMAAYSTDWDPAMPSMEHIPSSGPLAKAMAINVLAALALNPPLLQSQCHFWGQIEKLQTYVPRLNRLVPSTVRRAIATGESIGLTHAELFAMGCAVLEDHLRGVSSKQELTLPDMGQPS